RGSRRPNDSALCGVFHQVRPRTAGSSTRDGCESDHRPGFAGPRRIVEVSSRTREAPMDRRLVITADDLGVDPQTHAAIVDLLKDGLVSATTLIPVAPAALDAVQRITAAGVAPPRPHPPLSSARELPACRAVAQAVDF